MAPGLRRSAAEEARHASAAPPPATLARAHAPRRSAPQLPRLKTFHVRQLIYRGYCLSELCFPRRLPPPSPDAAGAQENFYLGRHTVGYVSGLVDKEGSWELPTAALPLIAGACACPTGVVLITFSRKPDGLPVIAAVASGEAAAQAFRDGTGGIDTFFDEHCRYVVDDLLEINKLVNDFDQASAHINTS